MSKKVSLKDVRRFMWLSFWCGCSSFVFYFQIPDVVRYLKMIRYRYKFYKGPSHANPIDIRSFLNFLIVDIERHMFEADPFLGIARKRKHARSYFLKALRNPKAEREIIAYLESNAIVSTLDTLDLYERIVTIMEEGKRGRDRKEPQAADEFLPVVTIEPVPVMECDPLTIITNDPLPVAVDAESRKEEPAGDNFYSRTYVIATQLYFERAGKAAEYETLVRQRAELEKFIIGHFKARQLPGTLSKWRGHSYKKILEGHKSSRKGQLKPLFRQIIDHPEVFGADVSAYAQQVFHQYLMQ